MMRARRPRFLSILLFAGLLCTPTGASALGNGIDVFLSALGGVIHRDCVLGLDAFLLASNGSFDVAFGAPLRFDHQGLREADWDEVTDFGRIVSNLSFSTSDKRVTVRLGTLDGLNLGVGNLVSHFYSTVDPDHWRSGVQGHASVGLVGIDAFLDSFLDPEIAGGRFYIRPFWPLSPDGFLGRLEIGGTAVGDFMTPKTLSHLASGPVRLTSPDLPATSHTAVIGAGVDLRWTLLRTDAVEVTPYGAWSMVDEGTGLHAGLGLRIRPTSDLDFSLIGEWKQLGEGYVAPYLDSLHMADRYSFDQGTKWEAIRAIPEARTGLRVGASAAWKDLLNIWMLLDLDHESAFSELAAGVSIRVMPTLDIGMHMVERGFGDAAAMFDPSRFLLSSCLTWSPSRRIAFFASYASDLDIDRTGADRGRYTRSDTMLAGVRAGF